MKSRNIPFCLVAFVCLLFCSQKSKAQTDKPFNPKFSLGANLTGVSTLDQSYGYVVYSIEAGYNLALIKKRTFNLSLEPTFGLGTATRRFNIFKSEGFAQSLDLALIARQKIRQVSVGFGWISGFTNITGDYMYWGYYGLTGRLGVQINPTFMVEAKGNLQWAFEDVKAVAGLSLIWLK